MRIPDAARPEDAGLSSSGLDKVDAGLQELIDKGELAPQRAGSEQHHEPHEAF
jgi:hypothetical protein